MAKNQEGGRRFGKVRAAALGFSPDEDLDVTGTRDASCLTVSVLNARKAGELAGARAEAYLYKRALIDIASGEASSPRILA